MFRSSTLIAFSCATLLPTAALAQESADKSPDQIQCELADSCAQATGQSLSLASDAAGADGSSTAAGDAEATRSWTWGRAAVAAPAQGASTRLVAPSTPARASKATQGSSKRRLRTEPVAAKSAGGRSSVAIGFLSGSAAFTDDGLRQADKIYQALSSGGFPTKRYLIVGYTDAAGDPDLNLELSQRRAQAVVDHLVAKGLPRENFRVAGNGSAGAVRGTGASATSNRRVEIVKLD